MSRGNYIRTDELKEYMKKINKGKYTSPNTEFKKGDNVGEKNPMYGKHLSEGARQKISKAHWKGGSIMSHRRAKDKRRGFDFVSLNNSFDGAEAHHIDKTYIIYMDEKDHESIYHSVLKNINMDEINALAWNYL